MTQVDAGVGIFQSRNRAVPRLASPLVETVMDRQASSARVTICNDRGSIMKSRLLSAAGVAAFLVLAAPASAVTIAQMDGDHNVVTGNTVGDPGTVGLGHAVTLFPDTSAGWTAALGSGSAVLLIEERAADFAPVPDITTYITGGGRMVVLGTCGSAGSGLSVMNSIFGTAMSATCVGNDLEPFAKTAAATGTTFEDDAATILGLSSHHEIVSGALPAGSTVFYEGAGDPIVFRTTLGAGDVFYLGWDYCCAGTQTDRDNWYAVLDSAITFASVPEPGPLALFGLGLAGLGFARRRKAA